MTESSDLDCFHVSDFEFIPDHRLLEDYPSGRHYIMNYEAWVMDHYTMPDFYPLFDLVGFLQREKESGILNLVLIRPEEVPETLEKINSVDMDIEL